MSSEELVAKELREIKMLLVALLIKLGAKSDEIASVLGMKDSSSIRKQVSFSKIKPARIVPPDTD